MRVVLCYPLAKRHLQRLQEAAPDWTFVDAGQQRVASELLEADVFCGHAKVPVDWEAIVARRRLRWIQSSAAGLDHCLVPPVIESDIVVTSASGLFADAVAEQTLCLLLALVRRLPQFFAAQQQRRFERQPTGDLHGKSVGIVGFGGNGRRIAEILAAFRCRIQATDWFPADCPDHVERLLPADRLFDLLLQSDVLILAAPLTPCTRGMIDREALARLPRGALLVNVARGPLVVEADLVEALRSGHVAGAGLDVTATEPLPASSPLWSLPQVVLTPHVGAQSEDRYDRITAFFAENIRRFRTGEPLLNLVDKKLGFPKRPFRAGSS